MSDQLIVKDRRLADIRFQDGALPHAEGVHSFQALRANREHPEWADGFGWTYNHAPMLAWYRGRFYLEYLSNPADEHEVPGQTLLTTSENGMDWSFPKVAFPVIEVPTAQYRGPRSPLLGETVRTVPHQRMGFYHAQGGVLLILSFYGIVHDRGLTMPCDGWGVGRAVRRVFPDGTFGEIHFLLYNTPAGYNAENTPVFSPYQTSADAAFVEACGALLKDGPVMQQMYEEQRFDKALFPAPREQALSFYTISDTEMMGVYKKGLSAVSSDGGRTFGEIVKNPTLRTATGKVWGQRTPDGKFALFYNPTRDGQHRWPIAVVTGKDGHTFDHMLAVTGPMSPLRYGGADKNLGPQYLRGICERNPQAPDGGVWLAYSNNKEDIWVSRVPVPVTGGRDAEIKETLDSGELPARWNIYSPLWAPVRARLDALCLSDRDPYDRAIIERLFTPAEAGNIRLRLQTDAVADNGAVCMELQDDRGGVPLRISLRADGQVYLLTDGRMEPALAYAPGEAAEIGIAFDCHAGSAEITLGGGAFTRSLTASVNTICRFVLATKEARQIPYSTADTVGKYTTKRDVLPGAGEPTGETRARLYAFSMTRR
ncbi:MAG: hypothetical protein JW811_02970 [Clostridiales bacterium]|nr:hypothetical protein [Clostridiales bacterium]